MAAADAENMYLGVDSVDVSCDGMLNPQQGLSELEKADFFTRCGDGDDDDEFPLQFY